MLEPTVIPQFDAETYLFWESRQHERFELHHGFVVAFAGGTLDRDRIALNLRNAFDRLYPAPCRSTGSDFKIKANPDSFSYPDASVVCEEATGNETSSARLRIVAEVLSPGTQRYDRIEKRAAYRGIESLVAYVIVSTDARLIEIDLRNADRTWRTCHFANEPIPLGNETLDPGDVYARTNVPIAESA